MLVLLQVVLVLENTVTLRVRLDSQNQCELSQIRAACSFVGVNQHLRICLTDHALDSSCLHSDGFTMHSFGVFGRQKMYQFSCFSLCLL